MTLNLAKVFEEKPEELSSHPMDGGGGTHDDELVSVTVYIALNGYTVNYTYTDMTEETYVFLNFDEVLEQLRSKH